MKGSEGHQRPPLAGRYGGGSAHKRPTIGQAYACQSSPQPHPPEKKQFFKQADQEQDEDPSVKQGLRSWRIHSYLSAYEDGGEEGLPQPLGPDAFEDKQPTAAAENSGPRFGIKEPPTVPSKPRPDILRPRFGKPKLPESSNTDSTTTKDPNLSVSDLKPYALEVGRDPQRAREVGMDVEVKEAPDLFLSKHDSFRTRVNPLLQRSSRLRSSLIFSSSKAEMHSGSLGLKPATEEDEELDKVRTSSIVAQILEKRRSLSREPFEWRKKVEEKEQEREKEKEEKKKKEEEEKEMRLKAEIKAKEELQKWNKDVKTTTTNERSEVTTSSSSLNVNDPASRLQYFKELAAKRKAPKIEPESAPKAPEPAEKPPIKTPTLKISTVSVSPAEPEPKKPDISSKLAELARRPSFSSLKPSIICPKPFVRPTTSETSQTQKEENGSEGQKKDIFKSLKPLPSPKLFRKDQLKFKGLSHRRISSGEEVLTTDATDAEKSELKKIRSQSSSTLTYGDSKDGLHKVMGSTTSINTLGEGKGEGKTLDFLKKQTQRLKGFLGPKEKEKKSSGDDKSMSIVKEATEDSSTKQSSSAHGTASTTTDQTTANNKTSTWTPGSSRYQAPGSSVLFNSNLRDDTKVILEQISANSQKNRQEREETQAVKEKNAAEKALENSAKRNRFLRPTNNVQEREGLLKRIESLRKEKKVYSRFEVVYHCKDDVCCVEG